MGEYEMALWLGVLAPAGTPGEIVERLHKAVEAVMRMPELAGQMAAAGIEVRTSTPEDFRSLIRSDLAKWAAVVKKSGMQPE